MSHSADAPPSTQQDKRLLEISFILGCISFLLGLFAYWWDADFQLVKILDSFYSSAHLLALHMQEKDIPEHAPAPLLIVFYGARLFAVCAYAAAAGSLWVRFRKLSRRFRLADAVADGNHAIICGRGPVGQELARQLCHAKRKVVVIEEAAPESLDSIEEDGLVVLPGNPANPALLRQAGIDKAALIFAASEDDSVNLSIGLETKELLRQLPAPATRAPQLFVHILDPELRQQLDRQRLLSDGAPHVRGATFSVLDSSARALLRDHPLDHVFIAEQDPRRVQLILAGFGQMGEAILRRAALIGHFANRQRMKITVFDREAHVIRNHILARYPNLDQVAEVVFVPTDLESPKTAREIADLCSDDRLWISTVVVPIANQSRAVTTALSLAFALPPFVPVRFRMEDELIASSIHRHYKPSTGSVTLTPFTTIRTACQEGSWANEDLDKLAREIHEQYFAGLDETTRNDPRQPLAKPWDVIPEEGRDSNRQAADHIPVKLRAIKCRIEPVGSKSAGAVVESFSAEEVKLLAKMEHRRWMAERWLAGWKRGPKNTPERVTPYLVEWDQLPPDIADYDNKQVLCIPSYLRKIGKQVLR